jgi:lipoprotein-releasing system permease protein
MGVALGVSALAIVMSVTSGFQDQFRDKVLGVNAHVLVLKYSVNFKEYRDVLALAKGVAGVKSAAPFVISPMMLTHGNRMQTGVMLKGADPTKLDKSKPEEWVLDLPKHITREISPNSLPLLRREGARPPTHSVSTVEITAEYGLREDERERIERGEIDDGHPPRPLTKSVGAVAPRGDAGALAPAPFAGDVTPDGGYKSELPEVDIGLDALDPDPCKDPALVAKLPGLVVGETLRKNLDVDLGDCVDVTSPTIGLSYGGRPPMKKQFRVIAIFEAGFDQYDSKFAYADLYEAQAFYDYGDTVTGIEIRVDDIDRAGDIADEMKELLHDSVYNTMDWKKLNHGLFTALLLQQIIMSLVLALIILVAAFTVIATLIMVVLEKKKEIALLKAIGARDSAILRVFLYQGGIIGLIGTALGLLLGYLACRFLLAVGLHLDPKVYFISELPVAMHATEFAVTGAIALVICLVGTIFPARYAATLRPSDGLRSG